MHETVRLQLFEVREGEQVKLMGEFKSTHQELQEHFADGIQQVNPCFRAAWLCSKRTNESWSVLMLSSGIGHGSNLPNSGMCRQRFNLLSPEEDKLTDGAEFMTFLRVSALISGIVV
jgi:hypothetical protein